MSKKYDFLIVGAGLYGAVLAHELHKAGKKCLILEKRNHIAGNAFTEKIAGIDVHVYGAHIFHTGNKRTWEYIRQFGEFNNFINSPLANYRGEIYNLPFNMNTFNKMWGVITPKEAIEVIEEQRLAYYVEQPKNLEEQALNLVGKDIFEKLIKGYTEKQWGRSCKELPAFIIKRLPVRFVYDNNYFNDPYQGIPVEGYTTIVERMLEGPEILLNIDYLQDRQKWDSLAYATIYTGPIDVFFHYEKGVLQYRKVTFQQEILNTPNFQGNAVVNYTAPEVPYTRIIEHKHFNFGNQPQTVVSYEFSEEWQKGDEPFYPINDQANNLLYEQYRTMANKIPNLIVGGRLGDYRYYDMDKTIEMALEKVRRVLFS